LIWGACFFSDDGRYSLRHITTRACATVSESDKNFEAEQTAAKPPAGAEIESIQTHDEIRKTWLIDYRRKRHRAGSNFIFYDQNSRAAIPHFERLREHLVRRTAIH